MSLTAVRLPTLQRVLAARKFLGVIFGGCVNLAGGEGVGGLNVAPLIRRVIEVRRSADC